MGQLKQNWFCRHRKPQKRMCLQTQKHHTFFGKEGTGEKKKNLTSKQNGKYG